ncbi:MAG: Crp/Fnr family transcriptional regulator [Oceanospirillaceae bacterium]|nr:Crp/Fnr family transcriptional regulator [Oceanospirillaceae bacterium]
MLTAPFDQIPQQYCRHLEINKGDKLFHQDNPTGGMFYIKSGAIVLIRNTVDGGLIIIHRATSGTFFAEASLFSARYHCHAQATMDTKLIEFDRSYLLQQFENNPSFSMALAQQFTRQLQQARKIREILAIKKASERTLVAIQAGLLDTNLISFAATIGLSHEALYRALSQLVKQHKLLKVARGEYRLPHSLL